MSEKKYWEREERESGPPEDKSEKLQGIRHLDYNCPLRCWARVCGGDHLSDETIERIWSETLGRIEFQKRVSELSKIIYPSSEQSGEAEK